MSTLFERLHLRYGRKNYVRHNAVMVAVQNGEAKLRITTLGGDVETAKTIYVHAGQNIIVSQGVSLTLPQATSRELEAALDEVMEASGFEEV